MKSMTFLRWIARALLLVIISAAALLWVMLATIQATVLNRHEVFRWLGDSGAYSHLVESVVKLQGGENGGAGTFVNQTTVGQALQQTLPPDFIRKSTETALNATYDWLYGKTKEVNFTIPLAEKRQEFIHNLAAIIQPKLAALPACSAQTALSANDITCLPAGQSASTLAGQMAAQSIEGTDFLASSVTPEHVGQTLNLPAAQSKSYAWLAGSAQQVVLWVMVLPGVLLACCAAFVLLTSDKRKGIVSVSSYVLFNVVFLLITGAVLWYVGGNTTLGSAGDILGAVVQPLLREIIPAAGMWLTIFSGAVCAACGVALGITALAHRSRSRHTPALPLAHPVQELPVVESHHETSHTSIK